MSSPVIVISIENKCLIGLDKFLLTEAIEKRKTIFLDMGFGSDLDELLNPYAISDKIKELLKEAEKNYAWELISLPINEKFSQEQIDQINKQSLTLLGLDPQERKFNFKFSM